ncbi:hypothetical protein [Streptomyces sp. PanSC9]|uniref:hypothetical protein n=1 Tax=Streptomyces sp. PanSC9 TaxID=1520461 RepID=UPI000F498446|nr:hypothetical protein [Streptomyces sp. PanSC9]ROP55938.1 hypothetical protein EDD94_5517 [Streptomyces sp. PanSC9]
MAEEFAELLGMAPASIDGGRLTFVRGSLHTTLFIWKDRRDRSAFGWMVSTEHASLRDRMDGFGGVGIRIDHPSPSGDTSPSNIPPAACYPWPAGSAPLTSEVSASVTRYGPASLCFVRDSHDLGLLLLADDHVHRDGVWSFTPGNSEPARLATAILLARQCADETLERAAAATLRHRGEEPVAPHPGYLFRHAVADWSRQYAKATGIDLSDLAALKRKRPQYPEIP